MNLIKLKSDYYSGKIDKHTYIKQIHKIHQYLYQYADFIIGTDIAKIHITDGKVIMRTRDKGITLITDRYDKRIVPIEILNFDYYEKDCLAMMLKLIKPKSTILDIGANIGWYTINFITSIKNATTFSFEPIPQTFNYLQENLKINNISNANIYNYGFYKEEKILTFYCYPEGLGNASAQRLNDSYYSKKIKCRVKKIDDFVREKKIDVDFIKCDVEGSELFVFQGGIETLKRSKPVIFTEMLRKWCKKFHYHPNDSIRLLHALGYQCFTISGDRLKECFIMDEHTKETNFFFLHSGRHAAFIKRLVI